MADTTIRISTQALVDTATKIRNCNAAMDEKLNEISGHMNNLNSTWQSDGATEIIEAMNAMKPRFEAYRGIVESYAKFLDKTAQSYEATETSVQTSAAQFK